MALLIPAFVVGLGLVVVLVIRVHEHYFYKNGSNNPIQEIAANVFVGYVTLLLFASLACVGVGAYWWLKHGVWLAITPNLVISKLGAGNQFADILMSEVSWMGLQQISAWYLEQNLGWTCLVAVLVLYVMLALSAGRTKFPYSP